MPDDNNSYNIPALVDAHAHLCLTGEPDEARRARNRTAGYEEIRPFIARHMEMLRRFGVAAVRDGGDTGGFVRRYLVETGQAGPPWVLTPGRAFHAPGRNGAIVGRPPGPGQTLAQLRQDLAAALTLAPPHLSAYHLTLEPNTPFAAQPPVLPDDDLAADMQALVEDTLGGAGYQHYETSAFAQPGQACRHNLNYWQFGDYLGIGAGAHGKLSAHRHIERQARVKHPRAYMEALEEGATDGPVAERRELDREDRIFEFMMNALRLNQGFDPRLFEARTGLSIAAAEAGLARAEGRGLIERDLRGIRPTVTGRRFLNELLQLFLA